MEKVTVIWRRHDAYARWCALRVFLHSYWALCSGMISIDCKFVICKLMTPFLSETNEHSNFSSNKTEEEV